MRASGGMMESDFVWREMDRLRTGVMYLAQGMLKSCAEGEGRPLSREGLAGLYQAISRLFALESGLMERLGYLEAKSHNQRHQKLLDALSLRMEDQAVGGPSSLQWNYFLALELIIHIYRDDRPLEKAASGGLAHLAMGQTAPVSLSAGLG